ncbi:MAG: hypothetical protein ACK2UP_01015, partial [Candidatus Promineifilaceae bacterium]
MTTPELSGQSSNQTKDRTRLSEKQQLAILNAIQQGLAANQDFQTIVDLVGDKIREIFGGMDVGIRIYDPETDMLHFPYIFEHG